MGYADLLSDPRTRDLLSDLERLPEDNAQAMRREHPGVPDDYLEFLVEVGYGDIGDSAYFLFGGLVPPVDLFDLQDAEEFLRSLLAIGHDYSEWTAAFDQSRDWKVVEICSETMAVDDLADSFEAFIRRQLVELAAQLPRP